MVRVRKGHPHHIFFKVEAMMKFTNEDKDQIHDERTKGHVRLYNGDALDYLSKEVFPFHTGKDMLKKKLTILICHNLRIKEGFISRWNEKYAFTNFNVLSNETLPLIKGKNFSNKKDVFIAIPEIHLKFNSIEDYLFKLMSCFEKIQLIVIDHNLVKNRDSKRSRIIQKIADECDRKVIMTSLSMNMQDMFFCLKLIDKHFMYRHEFVSNFCNYIDKGSYKMQHPTRPFKNEQEFSKMVERFIKTEKDLTND